MSTRACGEELLDGVVVGASGPALEISAGISVCAEGGSLCCWVLVSSVGLVAEIEPALVLLVRAAGPVRWEGVGVGVIVVFGAGLGWLDTVVGVLGVWVEESVCEGMRCSVFEGG